MRYSDPFREEWPGQVAGRVDFFFGPPALVLPHGREGKLRALVVNGASRTPALPDVPTTQEADLKDAEYPIWYGLFVPVKTPRDIVNRLHHETVKALQAPRVRERIAALFVDPLVMSSTRMSKKKLSLTARWSRRPASSRIDPRHPLSRSGVCDRRGGGTDRARPPQAGCSGARTSKSAMRRRCPFLTPCLTLWFLGFTAEPEAPAV